MQWVFAQSENFEMYVDRQAKRIWRRIVAEFCVEVNVLFEKWKFLFAGLVFQYIHGLAARGAHYFHQPGPILQDLGFKILPEIGRERAYFSEYSFGIIFVSFSLWTFHPFVCHSKRFYTVLLWCRVLVFLSAAQLLRILSFYSTQLPGPNYHCRVGSKLAILPPPKSIWEVLLLNFYHGLNFGCGDLIFSSHMIFTLVFVLTYHKYGSNMFIKYFAWLIAVIQSLLIVASRKHYSVDIVVAWYTVNLLVVFLDRQLPEMPDRMNGVVQILPLSTKEKHNKLLNGNSVEAMDWIVQNSEADRLKKRKMESATPYGCDNQTEFATPCRRYKFV